MAFASYILQAAPAGGQTAGYLLILAVFAIFYFLLIMPVQRRQKKMRQMLAALKTGDRVLTTGGIRGIIISLKDDAVVLKVAPDQLKLEFSRAAVGQVLGDESGSK